MAKDFRRIPHDQLRWYNGLDVAATLLLYRDQQRRAGVFEEVWRRLHGPAFHALGIVERWGALLSEKNVRAYDAFLQTRVAKVREGLKAHPIVPEDLNVKSPQQLHALIGGKLKLKSPMKTDTGAPSYGGEALEEMQKTQAEAGNHATAELLGHLREYLAARSMLASYGVGQLKHVGFDGRVHTTYKLSRSARLRSARPNLQNLKSPDDDPDLAEEDDDGKWARGCWVCPEGTSWVNLDYSQNELRVAALVSGDEAMIADFNSGIDFHRRTAQRVFAKAEVTKLERRVAKVINFRCVSADTQILTRRGWLSRDKVQVGDETPGRTGWVKVLEKVEYEDAPLVDWKGFRVTPNHRWWSKKRCDGGKRGRYYREEFTTLEKATTEHRIQLSRPQPGGPGCGLSPAECAVLAWIVTDGHVTRTHAKGSVYIHQSYRVNADKLEEIERVLLLAGVAYRRHDRPSGIAAIRLRDPLGHWRRRARILKADREWGESLVLRMTADERAAFVRAGLLADGNQVAGRWRWTQNRGPLCETFRLAFFLEGYFVRTYPDRKTVKLNLSKPQVTGIRLKVSDAGRGPVWCVRTEDETWTMRRGDSIAITGNTIFGGTDYGLGMMLKIPEEKATEYTRAYFDSYQKLERYLRGKAGEVAATGSSWGKWSREGWIHRREAYEAGETGKGRGYDKMRGHAERVGQNNEIQWLANCFGLCALTRVVAWIEDTGVPAQLVMTVHDNLALYVRNDYREQVAREVRRIMTDFDTGPVPLVVDVEMGDRDLGHLEKVKFEG